MSRLRTRMVALGFAGALLGGSPLVWADSFDDLKAKAKTVEQPNDAIQVSRQLRRAGLAGDAVQLMVRTKGKAKDNDALAAVHLELSRAYIDQRQQKKALRGCDPIKKLSEFTEQLCIAEAELLNRRGSTALPASERAMELKPGDYDAMVAKGRAFTILGKPSEAEAALKNASRAQSSRPEAFLYTGELLVVQGRVADALAALREARRVDPDYPEVLFLLGQTLPPGKEAREALERAISIRPSFTEARARLGVVLSALGELDQAGK